MALRWPWVSLDIPWPLWTMINNLTSNQCKDGPKHLIYLSAGSQVLGFASFDAQTHWYTAYVVVGNVFAANIAASSGLNHIHVACKTLPLAGVTFSVLLIASSTTNNMDLPLPSCTIKID